MAQIDTRRSPPLALAVSCGDPSGIGPDVILKAWTMRNDADLTPFVCLCDPDQMQARARLLGLDVPIVNALPHNASSLFASALPVIALENRLGETPGKIDTSNAAGIIEAITLGVRLVSTGKCAGLVTAPISKKPLYDAGFAHPGHTEYLAELAAQIDPARARAIMMIAGPLLRTVPVTIHIPLADVSAALTTRDIIDTITITAADLARRFAIRAPRIAVSGLNPHAGEGGALGGEDEAIIAPAIQACQTKGLDVRGPLPADTMFHKAARDTYDVAICMYHDQALIPAKALGFDDGVNVTLGLPFIRTSPDHGTAFDIAGKGVARPDSFIAALKMAAQMANAEATG